MNRKNLVSLEGPLTNDVRVTNFTKTGEDGQTYENTVANARIAVHGGRSGNDDETLFIDVELWSHGAIAVSEFQKGDIIRFEGCLRNKEWKDKTTGERRHSIVLRAEHFIPIYIKENTLIEETVAY